MTINSHTFNMQIKTLKSVEESTYFSYPKISLIDTNTPCDSTSSTNCFSKTEPKIPLILTLTI